MMSSSPSSASSIRCALAHPETTAELPVLAAIRRHKGCIQDRGYGGVIATLAEAIDRDGVRKIRLGDGLVRYAEPTLADDVPPEPLYVEWNGLSRLLLANDGVPCAAYISPDTQSPFAGALRFCFIAVVNGVPMPFPAMPIVDARPAGAQLSRVDRLRVRAGRPAAQDASRRQLAQMDRAVRWTAISFVWHRAQGPRRHRYRE